ncbi:hypothetical protein DYB28_000406 [Aphanomyces astaci]|uniref:EF-hand domain-containing protein n=2 Tax=Aphanomyces astaci TaxID=112090 RepID=A0A9X8E1Y8_APHAT|nr:hypothetical protein DYB28_000406 [Aphanomyces astaci]
MQRSLSSLKGLPPPSKVHFPFRSMSMEETPLVPRPSSTDNDLLITASWFVEDAFLGISRPHPVRTAFASRMYTLYADMHYLRGIAVVVLLGLSFFEIPPWCARSDESASCGDPTDPATPLTFEMAWITDIQSVCIEAACLIVLLANKYVRYLYLRENFTMPSVAVTAMIVTSSFLLVVRVVFANTWQLDVLAKQICGYFRVLIFAVKNRNVRRTARKIWLVVAEVHNILSLVVVFVVFFAWVATMVFQGTDEGIVTPMSCPPWTHGCTYVGKKVMPDIYDASWHMLILLTAANFPDVMMPAYDKNRLSVLFFGFFLCFGVFFLLNVVLAVIFNNFSRNSKLSDARRQHTRVTKLQLAFDLLCHISSTDSSLHPIGGPSSSFRRAPTPVASYSAKDLWEHRHDDWFLGEPSVNEGVPWNVMERLFVQMNHYRHIGFLKRSKMRLLFDTLDADGDGVLTWVEFQSICDLLHIALTKRRARSSEIERFWPRLYASSPFQAVARCVQHKRFETAIDVLLVVNMLLVVAESLPVLNGHAISVVLELNVWERLELVFSIVYLVELGLKVIVYGVSRYWSSMKNRFDGLLTLLILAVDVYVYLPEPNHDSSIVVVKVLLVARCLRLFRLIINIEQYRVFCMTWFRLLPFAKNLIVIMFCAMYMFALLGMQCFGGLISPAVMTTRFNDSAYTQDDYMANNFNDMASGIVTLFELIIVNNWFVLAEGHVLVTSKVSRWFFIVYYVVSVTLLLNLVVASILDERYMATSDLCNELQKDVELGPDLERKYVVVSPFSLAAFPLQEKQVGDICEKLCDLILNGKPELRDIYSIGLKTILTDVSTKTGASVSTALCGRLLIGIAQYADQAVKSDTLDILTELLKRFGHDFPSEHVSIMDLLLKELKDDRAFVRKRVTSCLGALGVVATDALLHRLVDHLLGDVKQASAASSSDSSEVRTLIQTIGTLSRTVGHRLGRHLPTIVPLFLTFCGTPDNEAMQNDTANELRENCFQGLEAFVLRCHAEITPHTTDILSVAIAFSKYDPNYMYGDDDGDDDTMQGDDADDDDQYSDDGDNDYSDDDDASWKVRRAALRVVSAIIGTRRELLELIYNQYSETLINRFKEREESVRIDVFGVVSDLLRATVLLHPPSPAADAKAATRPVFARQRSCVDQLHSRVGTIIAAANKQLGPKTSVATRCAVLGMLRELAKVEEGQLGPYLDVLVPNVLKALQDRNSSLKLDAILFLRLLLSTHDAALFQKHLSAIVPLAVENAKDDWYKIVAKALQLVAAIVQVLRPSPGTTSLPPSLVSFVQPLYTAVLPRLQAYDIDQEIKDNAIASMGLIVASLGDHLTSALPVVLPLIQERVQNEITRIAAIKALGIIARSPLQLDLSIVLADVVTSLSQLLRQQSRTLKQTALDTLIALVTSKGADIPLPILCDTVREAAALISDTDLQLSTLALTLVLRTVEASPAVAQDPALLTKALPNALSLAASALLQGQTLDALFAFLGHLVADHGFDRLFDQLYSTPRPDATKHALHNVARCVAAICVKAPVASQKKAFDLFVQDIGGSDVEQTHVALFCLGEFGRVTNVASFGDVRALILGCFQTGKTSEEVKHAAAFALGSVCVGNMSVYLPTILDELTHDSGAHVYLLLSALKEVLSTKKTDVVNQYVSAVLPVLNKHCESDEEGVRNMVAECLGKLALLNPALILPSVTKFCDASTPVKTRWTAVTCLKYCMACGPDGEPMHHLTVHPILSALQDEDMGVRRAALVTLNSAAHHQAAFLKPHVRESIVPILLKTMEIKLERVVDLGPFKHKVDDGLVLRKGAYGCFDTLLDTLPGEVDVNAFAPYLLKGLEDHDDVQMLSHQILAKLTTVAPGTVLSNLDVLCVVLDKALNRRPKETQVGSEVERINDVIRSALRAVDAASCIRDADANPKWKALMDKIKKTENLSVMLEAISIERGVGAEL